MADTHDTSDGASPWSAYAGALGVPVSLDGLTDVLAHREQLLYAAKTDAEDMAKEVLPKVGNDINKKDGLGMTGV